MAICRVKSGVPECPAALGRCAQAVDEALVERGVKERAACLLPFGRAPAKPVIELVAGQEAVIGTLKINSYPNFLAHRQFTWRLRNSRILRVASVAASSLYSSQ